MTCAATTPRYSFQHNWSNSKKVMRARNEAHQSFDQLWQCASNDPSGPLMTRSAAYKWLATRLDIPRHKCHIGMMDVNQCAVVIKYSEQKVAKLRKRRERTMSWLERKKAQWATEQATTGHATDSQ